MGRTIAGVVVGYLSMVVVVIIGFSLSLVAPEFAFQKDSLDVTSGWLAYTLGLSLVAAFLGGFVAVVIGRQRRTAKALAILVFSLGMFGAVANAMKEKPTKEDLAAMTVQERGSKAVQPIWYSFLLPFIGAGGILLGGRLRKATPESA